MKQARKKIHISAIANGTSIDHIPAGNALRLVEVVDLETGGVVTIALNVESRKMKKKDLIFIENKELDEKEINKIKLIARKATVNMIKNYNIVKKMRLGLPEKVEEIIECINPNCITNAEEISTKFFITSKEPLKAKCFYCETTMEDREIRKAIR